MTMSRPGSADEGQLEPLNVSSVSFPETRSLGGKRGYDEGEVDAFVVRCGKELDSLTMKIKELAAENAELRGHTRNTDDIVLQSVSILSTAQKTADAAVKNADDYSGQVMAEARHMLQDAKLQARNMLDEAHRVASEAVEQAAASHDEMQRQTLYLRTLRDSMHVQLTTTLEAIINHVTTEFGKAAPAAAAEAATQSAIGPGPDKEKRIQST
jgi:DivIVA domain-containing protein